MMRGRIGLSVAAAVSVLAGVPTSATERPPIVGVAHIAFHVSDLAKARAFYSGLLGYEEVYHLGDAARPERVCFKINDRQLVCVLPGLPPAQIDRLSHVAFVPSALRPNGSSRTKTSHPPNAGRAASPSRTTSPSPACEEGVNRSSPAPAPAAGG